MIESLRAFGYDLPSAIADLVDNSIFAGARNVWIDFNWDGDQSTICIFDDGRGMTEPVLVDAMRPGSRNPLDSRDPKDLGRYGLGLKTASFSQCRRFSVRSKRKDGLGATRCWDLDFVAFKNRWLLLRDAGPAAEPLLARLPRLEQGTAVLWQQMDRLVEGSAVDNGQHKALFHSRIESVERHLAMVFHRFMEGGKRLKIFVNDNPVVPWDPFLKREKATQQIAEENLVDGRIQVIPYVLPHISKLSAETHNLAAGPRGWNQQQGFYVYRNERLLVPGDWLGLPFAKEEHFKLARIQLDIPNSMDSAWEIDVTKSKSRPPDALRPALKHIADVTRRRASDVYRHRGRVLARKTTEDFIFVWEQVVRHGKYFYRVNREHPAVKPLITTHSQFVEPLLRVIEETVPLPLLAITNSEQPDKHSPPFDGAPSSEITAHIKRVYETMLQSKITPPTAADRLRVMEPFDRFPDLVEAFVEQTKPKSK